MQLVARLSGKVARSRTAMRLAVAALLASIAVCAIVLGAWSRHVPRQPFDARLSLAEGLVRLPAAPSAQQVATRANSDSATGEGAAVAALRRWVSSIGLHEAKVYSQYGEDGVINFIFANIGTTDKYFVEFGTMNGDECVTRFLFEAHHWKGLLMDGSNENAARSLHKEFIYAHNIVALFEKYHVPKTFDFLSVDIDGHDYHVLKALLKGGYSPRVINAEVNSLIAPGHAKSIPLDAPVMGWDTTSFYGASLDAMYRLCAEHGYSLVYCELTGVNCFFVRDDVLGGSLVGLVTPAMAQRTPQFGWGRCAHNRDLTGRPWVDVYPRETKGDMYIRTPTCTDSVP